MSGATIDLRPPNRLHYVAIAVLIAASIAVQIVRDRGWAPFVPPNPTMWLQSGSVADRVFLGYKNLVADVYWMRAVVYYGGRRRHSTAQQESGAAPSANFDQLNTLLNLVTSLDPHFKVAYRFGAIFLADVYPAGPGRPDLAIALLQRGIERDSARWEYMEDIGFIYFWWVKDFQKAAEWFKRAGDEPGAPSWLAPLAATTLAQGGQRQGSRLLWTQLLNSDIDWLRRDAAMRLQQLDAMDAIAELTPVLRRFFERERRYPSSWEELAQAEGLPRVPTDPTGARFYFDPKVGRIDVSPKSPLWPLPK
jgi:tetratricopeptide (TPR) repeat protein